MPHAASPKAAKQLRSLLIKCRYSQANCRNSHAATIDTGGFHKSEGTPAAFPGRKELANACSRNGHGKFRASVGRSSSQTYSLTRSSLSGKSGVGTKDVGLSLHKDSKNLSRIRYLMPIKEQYESSKLAISSTVRYYNGQETDSSKKSIEQSLSLNLDKVNSKMQINIIPSTLVQKYPTLSCAPVMKRNSVGTVKAKFPFVQSFRMSVPNNERKRQSIPRIDKKNSEYDSSIIKDKSPKFPISQSVRRDQKQFSTINLLKREDKMMSCKGIRCTEAVRSSDVIYEINECDVSLEELRKKCNVKRSEPIFLVPVLRNGMFPMKMAAAEVEWNLLSPELLL